jgi:hypothetical protein
MPRSLRFVVSASVWVWRPVLLYSLALLNIGYKVLGCELLNGRRCDGEKGTIIDRGELHINKMPEIVTVECAGESWPCEAIAVALYSI